MNVEELAKVAETENERLVRFLAGLTTFHEALREGYLKAGHRIGKTALSGTFAPRYPELKLQTRQVKPAGGHSDLVVHVNPQQAPSKPGAPFQAVQHYSNDDPFMGDVLRWRIESNASSPDITVETLPGKDGNYQSAPIIGDFTLIQVVAAVPAKAY